jgi:hypothetical protein
MPEHDQESHSRDVKANALARLATLQRLREQAKLGKRTAMLKSLDAMIEQEAKVLRDAHDRDSKPV